MSAMTFSSRSSPARKSFLILSQRIACSKNHPPARTPVTPSTVLTRTLSAHTWPWSSFSWLLALHQRYCVLQSGQGLHDCLPPPLPLPAAPGLVLLAIPPQQVPAASPCPCSCHFLDPSSNRTESGIELNYMPHCDDSGRRRPSYDGVVRRTTVIGCRRPLCDHVRQSWAYRRMFVRHRTIAYVVRRDTTFSGYLDRLPSIAMSYDNARHRTMIVR